MKEHHKAMFDQLINEGAIDEVVEAVKKGLYQQHYETEPHEIKKREELYSAAHALKEVKMKIKAYAQQGEK